MGSRLTEGISKMFGYVTDEDRDRWERRRQSNAKQPGAFKESLRAAHELSQQGINAKLRAEEQAVARDERDAGQTTRRTRTITEVESVDFEARDSRQRIDDGLDIGL